MTNPLPTQASFVIHFTHSSPSKSDGGPSDSSSSSDPIAPVFSIRAISDFDNVSASMKVALETMRLRARRSSTEMLRFMGLADGLLFAEEELGLLLDEASRAGGFGGFFFVSASMGFGALMLVSSYSAIWESATATATSSLG